MVGTNTTHPANWDHEADFVAVGAGIGGLAAAVTAREFSASAAVLESSSHVGGVTAYSFGQVWIAGNHHAQALGIEDSPEKGFQYIKRLGMGYAEDELNRSHALNAPAVLRFFEDRMNLRCRVVRDYSDYYWPDFSDGMPEGRFLEVLPFPAATLGEWQERTRTSPYVPYGLTHEDIFGSGGIANLLKWDFSIMAGRLERDERCLGPGLAAYFVKGAIDRNIPMFTDTRVEEIVTGPEGVIGVVARRNGSEFRVRARRGVVLATSGVDGNNGYERTLAKHLDVKSMVMPSVNGSHIRLAGRLGARVATVPDVSMFGYSLPGEEQEDQPLWRNAMTDAGLPHAIIVNGAGRRFGDESFYRSIGFAIDYIDGSRQLHPNFPCWIILDNQSRQKYPFGSLLPGQEFPQGFAIKADTLSGLARAAGIDADGLCNEVARFNAYCETGVDPQFRRGEKPWAKYICGDPNQKPNPNLGSIAKGPFYAVCLSRISGGGVAAAGLACDVDARVLDYDNRPIAGLYVAGNAAARLDSGAGVQSGLSNARGMTQGFLAGRHAAKMSTDGKLR
jgi:3-oxosteroid 1-dehydrogenase